MMEVDDNGKSVTLRERHSRGKNMKNDPEAISGLKYSDVFYYSPNCFYKLDSDKYTYISKLKNQERIHWYANLSNLPN